jgi:hypothetical protein
MRAGWGRCRRRSRWSLGRRFAKHPALVGMQARVLGIGVLFNQPARLAALAAGATLRSIPEAQRSGTRSGSLTVLSERR